MSPLIRLPVALVLLFSAMMKAWQTMTEPVTGMPWFEVLAVEYEFCLALAILLGLWPRYVRLIAAGTFLMFFVIALRLAWVAADSCGCFGRVHVDPRVTAVMDAVIVLILIFARVTPGRASPTRRQGLLFLTGLTLTLVPVFGMLRPHPPVIVEHDRATNPVESESVIHDVDLGYVEPRSVHKFQLELFNPTERTWRILRTETECECLVVTDVPRTLPPGKRVSLALEFQVPPEIQSYSKTITITTDDPDQPTLVATLRARIGLPLAFQPERVEFPEAEPGRSYERTVTIRNDGPNPVKLLYSQAQPPVCFVRVPVPPIPAGECAELPLILRVPETGLTTTNVHLVLKTGHAEQKSLSLQVLIGP